MQAIVAQHLPGTGAELVFGDGRLSADGADARATAPCSPASTRSTATSAFPKWPNSTPPARRRRFLASSPATSDTLAGLGAAGGGAHAEGEWVDLDSLPRQAKRAAILITRLTRERRD